MSQSATVEVEDKYNTAAMLMTRVAFLGTVATALRAGSARRAPFWRRSQVWCVNEIPYVFLNKPDIAFSFDNFLPHRF